MKVQYIENNGNNIKCEYQKRKNSKKISVRVENSGIVKISLPYFTPYFEAKYFVNSNIDWIKEKLKKIDLQKNDFYYLGNKIDIFVQNNANIKNFNYILSNNNLIIETNKNSTELEDLYIKWLRLKAKEYIPKKAEEFAQKHNFKFNSIKIKNLTSRWGSCSIKKNLSFNLKLMYFNYKVIDYVIIHELCHLQEMNHSHRFWNLVGEIMPDYKLQKKQLSTFPTHKT